MTYVEVYHVIIPKHFSIWCT